MTISISNDGSYFSIGYIDYNYIAPDILVLGATSVSSVTPSLSLSLNIPPVSTDIGTLGIINTSTGNISLIGIESISQLGSLRLELSDNTNPNQINANISSVSIQLSSNIQSSNLSGYPGSIGNSNEVTIQSTFGQSYVGSLTAISESTTTIQLTGNLIQSDVGNNLASISKVTIGQEISGSTGILSKDRTIGISSTIGQSDIGSIGVVTDGSITLGLSGISVQSYVDNISKFIDCSTTGNQSQSDIGNILSLHQTTSTSAISSVGSVNSTIEHTISSLVLNATLGNLTLGKLDSALGNETAVSIGSLSNYSSFILSGISNQSNIATLTKNLTVELSGIQSSGYVNSLLELDSIQLSSNIGTSGLGILGYTKSDSTILSQVNSVASQGTTLTNITVSVSGITSYGLIQSEIPVEIIIPRGNSATVSQGNFTVSSSSTVNLTSVLGTSSTSSIDSVVSKVTTSYQLVTNVGSLSNSSDITNTGILSTIVQQPLYATHTVDSNGNQSQSDIGNVVKSFGTTLYTESLVGYTGNLNKYSTTSIFGLSSSISNGNVGTNLLTSIYNPTLVTSLGYFAHFIESDDIYYYGPIQFELINNNIIPFTVSLPIESGFNDIKEIETKFNSVFISDTEFKNTKSFKGVCI